MAMDPRGERLQIMLTKEELVALDNWRFDRRMPSRAAAVRELLRRGLDAEGFAVSDGSTKSGEFSVVSPPPNSQAGSEMGNKQLRASK
jgi:metal-responsive CopG/Arc/MetJ family transcriptional regulator